MGGLYPESYAKVVRQRLGSSGSIQIADFGSGSGDWYVRSNKNGTSIYLFYRASDIAQEFPHAQAIGIDLTPSSPVFETGDVNKDMSEYYEKLDMVHVRNLTCGVGMIQPTLTPN
ncbi:hypothetical protein FRC10_004670 [Ceratobasidium sp. 414]|nr:hypothetical protein FRC10_004670 [Ceratobasidium sp. 414]